MTLWNDMTIGICLLLLVLLLWKELRRANRSRLPARMTAAALAVIGLACMALPLSYSEKNVRSFSGKEGILLTEGYDPDSLRQFLQTVRTRGEISDEEVKVFSAIDGLPMIGGSPGTGEKANSGGGLTKLHVFGYGLTRKEWASLHPPPLIFHPSAHHAGIVSVSWKQKLLPGEKLRVQGSWVAAAEGPVKLLLTGMGMPLDSLIIAAGGQQKVPAVGQETVMAGGQTPKQTDFELNTIPAQSGRSVYHLSVVGVHAPSGIDTHGVIDTLEQELLPIEVLPEKKLKILLLAASPDFENTFLVNWLSRNGHAVATRTTISKGKYDKAFLNMPETALGLLTPSILDKFDIVIADAAALQAESSVELSNLHRQVAEKGMGLIIKADSVADIKERPGTRSLLRDSLSRTVVSSGIYGSGKLIFTALNTTYYRILSGEKKEYAAYWSSVLQKAAREEEPEEDWRFAPDLPRVNEPVEALLQTNKNGLPQGQFGSNVVYLAGSSMLPFLWKGTYWPVEAGWQPCATLQGDTSWWYAWPTGSWQPIYRRQRWKETEEYIAEQASKTTAPGRDAKVTSAGVSPPESQRTGGERVLISKVWFYTLFLLSCIFLWIERKV